MKRARLPEKKIRALLKKHQAGVKTAELARKHGVSRATIYNWKARFDSMASSEPDRLRTLEEENSKLRKLLLEQMLQADTLRELLSRYAGDHHH